MEIPLVILSHRRAGRVLTHKNIADTVLCVPESQVADYAQHHDRKTFIVHPDSIIGGSNKRQWVYERLGDVFFLDDDCTGMARLWRPKEGRKSATVSPRRAAEIIRNTAETAKECGAFLFGFGNHPNPITYHPLRPFCYGGYITGGAMGLLAGSKISHPDTTLPLADFWVCLINAYHHRFSFVDTRFGFGFAETYTGTGGNSEFRKEDTEPKCFSYLRKHFGECVVKGVNKTGATTKQKNSGKRAIRLPFNA